MASIPVTITGVLTYSGLEIGGGPMPGGPPPWVSHPIPPTVWPNPPGTSPGNPPGFWGGTPPSYVDIGGPGAQPHPSHPIAPGGGRPPLGTWGGASEPFPTNPIYIPPGLPPVEPPADAKIEWKSGWSADQGWVTVGIITPDIPVPTPST